MFAKRNLLSFDTRDISRSNLRIKDIKQVAKSDTALNSAEVGVHESRMYGSTKTSYLPFNETTRLVIKHNGHIDDSQHGARSRRIHAVYIEDGQGQRLKCPTNNLTACKAFGRHVASGGALHDEFGVHINELAEEMSKIKRFVSGSRHKTFEDDEANVIAQNAKERYHQVHSILNRLRGPRGYHAYKESWDPSIKEADDINLDELRSKFSQTTFDSRLEDGLPYAYRAHKNKQVAEFEDWANKVTEGTWAVPNEESEIQKLQELMSDTLEAGIDGQNAISALYDIVGDDALSDYIYDASQGSPEMDVRPIIYNWLEHNMPSVFDKVKGNMEAGGISQNEPTEPETSSESDSDSEQDQKLAQQESAVDPLHSMRRLAGL